MQVKMDISFAKKKKKGILLMYINFNSGKDS